jgi:hypothetical protein
MASYSPSSTFYEAAGYLSNASSLSNVPTSVKLEVAKPFSEMLSASRVTNLLLALWPFQISYDVHDTLYYAAIYI